MSTIDPAEARRQLLENKRSDAGLRSAVLWLSVAVAAGFFAGYVIVGQLGNLLWHSAFADGTDDRTVTGKGWLVWPGLVALFALIVSALLAGSAIKAYQGRRLGSTGVAPFVWVAITTGLVVSSLSWELTSATNTGEDLTNAKVLSGGGEVISRTNLWLPALFVAFSAFSITRAVWDARRTALWRRRRDRLLIEGTRVPGTVEDIELLYTKEEDGNTSLSGATVTVKYSDAEGVSRWIVRTTEDVSVSPSASVEVLYDSAEPADDSSIFVAFKRIPATVDWV